MADVKISQLTELTTPTGNEELVYAYNWANWKIKLNNIQKVKVFTLADTSDLTNAQAAYDWYKKWWYPIINFNSLQYYHMVAAGDNYVRFQYTETLNNSTQLVNSHISISWSSGTMTSISYETWLSFSKRASLPSTPDANTVYFLTN